MRKNKIAILILISVMAMMFISSCGDDGGNTTLITGTLMSLDMENATVNIDGKNYKVAEGMKNFESQAEVGIAYEFTLDIHGNIVSAKPL